MSLDEVDMLLTKWESKLMEIESRHRDGLMAARDMLASLAENLMTDGNEPAAVMEALEERMMDLEEQADQDFEMVQLGLAVAIITLTEYYIYIYIYIYLMQCFSPYALL